MTLADAASDAEYTPRVIAAVIVIGIILVTWIIAWAVVERERIRSERDDDTPKNGSTPP